MPLDTKTLERLAERVARLCKNFNEPNGIPMSKDSTWAELTNEALPELENYFKES